MQTSQSSTPGSQTAPAHTRSDNSAPACEFVHAHGTSDNWSATTLALYVELYSTPPVVTRRPV